MSAQASAERRPATVQDAGRSCPYCRFTLKEGAEIAVCEGCSASHHGECWDDNNGCAVMGCSGAPPKGSHAATPLEPDAALPPAPAQTPLSVDSPDSPPRQPWTAGMNEMPGVAELNRALSRLPGDRPPMISVLVGLQALAGVYLVLEAVRGLFGHGGAVNLFSITYTSTVLDIANLLMVLVVAVMGVALVWLARRVYEGDGVARVVTYVACGTVASTILFSSDKSTGRVLVVLIVIAVAVALWRGPTVDEFFASSAAPDSVGSRSVAVMQRLLVSWLAILAVVGLIDVLIGFSPYVPSKAKYLVAGFGLLAIAAYGRVLLPLLVAGSDQARRIVSGAMAVSCVLVLIAGNLFGTGMFLPLGWSIGTLIFLWLDSDLKAFFVSARQGAPPGV